MAVFNPAIQPTQAPDYTGFSKVVDAPAPNKSTAIALETLGTGLSGVVNLADQQTKKSIDDDIYKKVDAERDAYTAGLQMAKADKAGVEKATGSVMDASASMDTPSVPTSLDAGLSGIDTLNAARQAGKINDTYYTQQLNSIAKNMRTQYPGYRDYIDQKMSAVSGMDPANAYYKNIMQDLNAKAVGANSEKNKQSSFMMKNDDIPWNATQMQLVDKGVMPFNQYYQNVNKYRSDEADLKARRAAREDKKGTKEDTADEAKTDLTKEMGSLANVFFSTTAAATSTGTVDGQIKFLDSTKNMDPAMLQQSVTGMELKYREAVREAQKRINTVDRSGQSYATRMGGIDKAMAVVTEQLKPMRDYIDAFNNKDYGLGTLIQRQMAGRADETQRALLENIPELQDLQALNKIAPQNAAQMVNTFLAKNVDQKMAQYISQKAAAGLAQRNAANGEVRNYKADVIDAKSKKIDPKTGVFEGLGQASAVIADPSVPQQVKLNASMYLFDPKNAGVLNEFQMDYVDPQTKKLVPGKYSVYNRFMSSDVTREMLKLRNAPGGDQAWKNYKNWGENEFGAIFRKEAANITDMKDNRYKIGWDSDNNRLLMVNDKGTPVSFSQGQTPVASIGLASRTIDRLNYAMSNLARVHEADGGKGGTGLYLLKMLDTLQPGTSDTIRNAVLAASKKKTEEGVKMFYGDKE